MAMMAKKQASFLRSWIVFLNLKHTEASFFCQIRLIQDAYESLRCLNLKVHVWQFLCSQRQQHDRLLHPLCMGGAPYVGLRLGGGLIFEVSVFHLDMKERPGKLPMLSS